MDYSYIRNIDLYRNLGSIQKRLKSASRKLGQTLAIYDASNESLADVILQSRKEIGLFMRLRDDLGFIGRNLYYYRPTNIKYARLLAIHAELVDSYHANRQHGRNDLRKDLDAEKAREALWSINSAFDDIEDILLLPGLLQEINKRKGIYANYIGDRLWQVLSSVVIAILTGIIGLLIGIMV